MAKVLNRHIHGKPPTAVYIGRGTKWGNPYVIGVDGTREEVIAKYEQYIRNKYELLADLGELDGKDLLCSCAPRPCHGDVLIKLQKEHSKGGAE